MWGLCGSVLAYFYSLFSFTLVQVWQKVEVTDVSQRFLTMTIVFGQKASFYIIYKCCTFFWVLFYFQKATHLTLAYSFPERALMRWYSSVSSSLGPTTHFLFLLPHAAVTYRNILVKNERKILEDSTVLLICLKFRFTLRGWVAFPTFCSNLVSMLNLFLSPLPCSDNYAGSILFLSF